MTDRKTVPRMQGLRPVLTSPGQGVEQPTEARESQTLAGNSFLIRYANLVRLPHTLFALPFALVGTIYASYSVPVGVRQVALILLAFTAARFAAMGFNRIADRQWDALNPRTKGREIPSGQLSAGQAAVAVALASFAFVVAAALLNPLCFFLSVPALFWILAYSYTKRFTSWSHVWLGASLAIAPVGGYLAVAGQWSTPTWTLIALAVAVLLWVTGFDIFYALQDREFDRQHGLRSAVVLLGLHGSIRVAKLLHYIAILLLLAFAFGAGLGRSSYLGVAAAVIALLWEHRLVKPADLSGLNAAFFTMNGIMSVVVCIGMLVDRLV